MNYLIASLEGEPQHVLKQFQVSSSNYTSAIEFLKKGTKCCARSRIIDDQRVLYEDLSTIVNQMIMKGESVDSVLIQKQMLSKFSEPIQRYEKQKQFDTWSTTNLLSHVCDFIDAELEIQRHVNNEEERQEYSQSGNNQSLSKTTSKRNNDKVFGCFFCEETGHSPRECTYFTTREQCINHMKRNSLCMNCGESSHRASECSKGACRLCNKTGHHTSICRQANPLQDRRPLSEVERKALPAAEPHKLPPQKVARIEHLTESLQQSKLTKEDKQYLSRNNLQLSINHKYTEIRPEILLGCSDTFPLINDQNMETKTLPSRLRLITSLLGYLVIEKNADKKEEEPVIVLSETKNEEAKWDEFLALQASGV
uniref:CCHC-type domain-containing protein n=1 Tax=Nippostrongylus brasiliensis TaxID=27835 RepID=A0A0N4YDG9_NIPBR